MRCPTPGSPVPPAGCGCDSACPRGTRSFTPQKHCGRPGRSQLTRCDVRVPRFATVDLTGEVVDEVSAVASTVHSRRAGQYPLASEDGRQLAADAPARSRPTTRVRNHLGSSGIRAIGIDLGVLEILDRQHDEDAVAHLGPDCWVPTGSTGRRGQPDRTAGSADRRGAAGPARDGGDRQCLLQRTVLHQRTAAQRCRSARYPTRSGWSGAHEKCCGPTDHGGTVALPATPDRAVSSGCTDAPGRSAVAAAPRSKRTAPATGSPTGVQPANVERPQRPVMTHPRVKPLP